MTKQPAEDEGGGGGQSAFVSPARGGGGLLRIGRHTFRSFKNPAFRLLFGAQMGQMAAMNMQMMVRVLLIKHLTESPALAGNSTFQKM